MAPEQTAGEEGYGKEVDWWSLGATILVLMTGKVCIDDTVKLLINCMPLVQTTSID